MRRSPFVPSSGMALLAVLFALTLLMLLALPFAVSMSVGADAAAREAEDARVQQASASVRDLLLDEAALSHPAIDPTPMADGLDEYPGDVSLPKEFAALREDGKVRLGGGAIDLQRFLPLEGASPLLIANVLGSTTRLREELLPDASEVALDDASNLPPSGMVYVGDELIRYGERTGTALRQLERGVLYPEFGDGKQPIPAQELVLDWRCVVAASWPAQGPDPSRKTRRPFRTVEDLLQVEAAGYGGFTPAELDRLRAAFAVDTMATTAPTWGRPERVFVDLVAGESKVLVVKSSMHLGPGSTVRLRNTRTGDVEFGLVMASATQNGVPQLQLPSTFMLRLLHRVLQAFPAVDTVVEPLIPAPVNVNTASVECLTALLANLRQPAEVRQTEQGSIRSTPPAFAAAAARQLAEDIALLRVRTNQEGTGPFAGWQDLVERLWRPRLEAAATMQDRNLLLNVYRNLQTGRDTVVEMGTAPICFQSGPWVGYRAAASRSRSSVDPAIRARHERTGVAAAVPGFTLERRWATQEQFEDAFLLDRRAPFWTTNPVNVGAIPPNSLGNDPAGRFAPHLLVYAFPQMGFGQARFPARDDAAAGIQPMPASAMPSNWNRSPTLRVQDTLAFANDVRGHDVGKQGALSLVNTGPSQPQGQPGQGQGQNPTPRPATTQQGGGRHDQISFPFSTADSFVGKFGLSAWFEPQSLGAVTLFEHGDGNDQRNRLAVEVRDGNLLLESIDEAGLDPNPGASPAGVPRTATQVALPLAELGLPANTPVHVSFQASGGRPSDLALHVDGFPRGRAKYRTYLTAALPVYDPQRANNATLPGVAGNEKYVDLQVESTEGFPQVGLLRIGAELFEYTSIRGNTFRCQFNDSMGGRAARQVGREMRPDIPVDAQGNPTVDFNSPQLQNVNLDVFPAHPAGSLVELAGWSLPLSEDTPMMVDKTTLDGAIGGFAVARAYIDNPRPITISIPQGPSFPIGTGIDENWSGTLLLADPVPSGRTYPPSAAQEEISNAFPTTGGYALLVQGLQRWDRTQATTSASATFGGVEVIRYAARQGNQLSGVQRAQNQAVPGQDGQISRDQFDGRPRRFVVNYEDYPLPNEPGKVLDDLPTEIVFVVPISLPVVNPQVLWDPQTRQLTEWCQLLPAGGSAVDTEWVRYDCIADRKHIVRGNRAAWEAVRFMLTNRIGAAQVDVGPLGPNSQPSATTPPWMQVSPTSGYIGYIPQIESTWPQIHAARNALAFRGDPFTGTSSHPQPNATVMACHRMQLNWGNFGAYTGRAGRLDRVAMVQGSTASGTQRPPVEWQTVNWSCRRYGSDNLQQNQTPPERLGPWPFQLIAFQDRITNVYLGPPRGTPLLEPRRFDRLVKFPSGELPAAWCEQPTLGAGLGNAQAMQGVVDEVELVQHARPTLVLDDDVAEAAQSFRVQRSILVNAAGPMYFANDLTPAFPQLGGLVQIDDEVVAYQSHADGSFQVAQNGRGLLNTQPRAHSRGARVEFLSTRPAAILAGGVGIRDAVLPLQDSGALPSRYGTVLLGQELLHYTWVRRNGDQLQLEMPRHHPPADEGDQQPRGLFRGRYGTTPATGSAGQPVVMFPFRYWDRHVDRSDDPELAYFQLTQNEAPGYFRSLRWREETQDPRVDVVCRARIDGKLGWDALPAPAAGLFELRGGSADAPPHRLAHFGARLELRFATRYQPGCVDLATYRAHGWKTTAKIEDVRVEYEGQRRVMVEEVTAR